MEVCKYATPEWREIEPEHFCACHLFNDAEAAARAEETMAKLKAEGVKEE